MVATSLRVQSVSQSRKLPSQSTSRKLCRRIAGRAWTTTTPARTRTEATTTTTESVECFILDSYYSVPTVCFSRREGHFAHCRGLLDLTPLLLAAQRSHDHYNRQPLLSSPLQSRQHNHPTAQEVGDRNSFRVEILRENDRNSNVTDQASAPSRDQNERGNEQPRTDNGARYGGVDRLVEGPALMSRRQRSGFVLRVDGVHAQGVHENVGCCLDVSTGYRIEAPGVRQVLLIRRIRGRR